jgi:DnaJ-class molecular chaperone
LRPRKKEGVWQDDSQVSSGNNAGDGAVEEKFKQIFETYAVLHDADKRAADHRARHAAFEKGSCQSGYSRFDSEGFRNPTAIFSEPCGNNGFGDLFGVDNFRQSYFAMGKPDV